MTWFTNNHKLLVDQRPWVDDRDGDEVIARLSCAADQVLKYAQLKIFFFSKSFRFLELMGKLKFPPQYSQGQKYCCFEQKESFMWDAHLQFWHSGQLKSTGDSPDHDDGDWTTSSEMMSHF